MIIQVKQVGEESGFCREYYRTVNKKQLVARQEDWPGVFNWYTCSKDGEPCSPIRQDVEIQII